MTYPVDLLGRAPVMKAPSDEDYISEDDWTGEGLIRAKGRKEQVKRNYRRRKERATGAER